MDWRENENISRLYDDFVHGLRTFSALNAFSADDPATAAWPPAKKKACWSDSHQIGDSFPLSNYWKIR
eukprot:scaffold1623_cov165-Ochromonas_danica.AAC.4